MSTALAGGVILSAFNQRANFYSACVYLAQSNLCLMVSSESNIPRKQPLTSQILINLILLIYGGMVYCLQRLCYGPLRPIEVEQLYEKAWFAITETCLAMTIFREEVGARSLVMFVALLTGKIWGWIGEGRVEVLEQQPPPDPRLFHIRLSISLAASVLYDVWLMNYTTNMVIQQARPNMMVMFLFEFAVLTTSSFSTAFRYCISLVEASIVKKQTHDRLLERRREVREERAEILRQREAAATAGETSDAAQAPLPSEDDVDEMDIEVPGWDGKGQCILTLDLVSGNHPHLAVKIHLANMDLDFVKLAIYMTFFFILLTFYGLPIHIMRDLFVTARSFLKRLTAFLRYRQATQDMNARYEDASAEDIRREDTCIICREEMRPWSVINPQAPPAAPDAAPRPAATVNERSRPKKLPCGHILHLGCLKSWLERQQVCPTCRRSVVENPRAPRVNRGGAGQPAGPGQQDGAAGAAGGNGQNPGMRMINFGPLRLGFGQAPFPALAPGMGGQAGQPNAGGPRVYGLELGFDRRARPQGQAQNQVQGTNTSGNVQDHLRQIEQELAQEIRDLQVNQQELRVVQLLQAELARLRLTHSAASEPVTPANAQLPTVPHLTTRPAGPQVQRHTIRAGTVPIPAGSNQLPRGVSIPEGWSFLPLQRADDSPAPAGPAVPTALPNNNPPSQARASSTDALPHETRQHQSRDNSTSPPPLIRQSWQFPTDSDNTMSSNSTQGRTETLVAPVAQMTNGAPVSARPQESEVPARLRQLSHSSSTHPSSIEGSATATDNNVRPSTSTSLGRSNSTSFERQIGNPPEEDQTAQSSEPVPSTEPANDEDTVERRREKGKGRAVTIEDDADEANV